MSRSYLDDLDKWHPFIVEIRPVDKVMFEPLEVGLSVADDTTLKPRHTPDHHRLVQGRPPYDGTMA